MSHFTTVKTKIFDLEALEEALKDLKFTVAYNALVYGWRGITHKADLVAKPMGCEYDIGFIQNKADHSYDIVADWWGVQASTGFTEQAFANEIKQRYAYCKVLKEVTRQGFAIAENQVEPDQSIRLVVRKW